ncbi:MAG: TonB family protein, partial [Candidatus Gastranaerophilales bacterium]|nr:TonB family protein [Candidatus Gastranaerophilales bacterium]
YLKTASEVQVDNTELLNLTAQACKMTGRADEAISLFENILEKEPENGFANAKIAEIYFQRLQYGKAIPYYKEALFFTFDENTAIQLAKCYLEIGDFDNAESMANEILKANPENKQAKSLKISLEYKRGLLPSAIKKNTEENPIEKEETPLDENIVKNYIMEFENSIKANWIPPSGSNLKKVSVKFSVDKDGNLISNTVYQSSGMSDFDKSALDAIELSAPFPPLPYGINRETLDIIFTFDFNIKN